MGCSPSKGKLFSKPEGHGPQKPLLDEPSKDSVDPTPLEEVNKCLGTNEEDNELLPPIEEHFTKDNVESQFASDTAAQNIEDIKEEGVLVTTEEIVSEVVQTDKVKKTEKTKKNKGRRRSTEKQRKSFILQKKVDFPPHMVRAHQAAYAFLNPNISKYETLLGLLDQAAETHLTLQPMMSALVLRFEEINQALEEMAEEGELMLNEHGVYMALPSGMMGPAVIPVKPGTDTDPPPDLLQQLLQNSIEKMRCVGGSVQALGDTTLEEAVEYFSSLSQMLVDKLHAKQEAQQRVAHVLAQVEVSTMRKSNPEDISLHSEDSGFGGENESLTGSDRHRRHRGSGGSGSCGSGVNISSAFDSPQNKLPSLIGQNEDDEEDEEDDNDDEEYEDEEVVRPVRKRLNSSPPDPSQPRLYMHSNYMQDRQPAIKRPLTATTSIKPKESSSNKCVNIIMELQKSQRDLDQRMKKMAENQGNKALVGPNNLYRAGLRRYSLRASAGAQKSPCCLPMLAPQRPKHHSVRRLINTFSQGIDGRPGQSLANVPLYIRRPRKSEILLLSETVNVNDGCTFINGKNNNNSWPDSRDDMDVDNLPPPPPEVLLDNSFQRTENIQGNAEGLQENLVQRLPMINQKTGVSQRLKSSLENVEMLPNRISLKPKSISILPVSQNAEKQLETDLDPGMEKTNCLYQQATGKIIHLHNADKRNVGELRGQGPSPLQTRMGQRCESKDFYDGEMTPCSLPVTAPPVSRVRLPPSCPSVCHRFPSPPVVRPQITSKPSSRPSSPRTVTRATDNNIEEMIPSVTFHDARSVFCQNESQNTQTCLSLGSSVLPRSWEEVSRGRLPMRVMNNSTRRTQSDQRPSLTSDSEFSKDGSSASTQADRSKPPPTKYRLMTGDDTQLDLSPAAQPSCG
ncbi:uncharacterized protein pcare2 [Scophthalmus maximus]|uniref:uncharacterized protein pcare2 n=1 Tax=Scophthalmus maximus TaxID=52904 RepID=UPI001FA859AB|nr:uncharacterized protein pcare2 [Scophthalmus maximus]